MNDKLDKDLKNRIREVFDHYEDDTADAGWELLRQRFPEEKKRRVIAWWWYPAAAVLLLCLGTWFFYPQTANQQMVIRQKTTTDSIGTNHTEAIHANAGSAIAVNKNTAAQSATNHTAIPSTNGINSQPQTHTTIGKVTSNTGNKTTSDKAVASAANNALAMAALDPARQRSYKNHQADQSRTSVISIPQKVASDAPGEYIKTDKTAQSLASAKEQPIISTQKTDAADSGANYTATQVAVVQQPAKTTTSVVIQKIDPVLKMIADDDARRLNLTKNVPGNKKSETVKSNRAVIMGLFAGTYFNYAKGSQSQLGIGGGFSSDFRINDNFKISTGVSIGQNRLSYSSDNNIPQQINNQALAMVKKSDVAAAYSLVTSLRTSVPEVTSYSASLMALDVPLNIKYQFNPKKNDTYISAGISSGTYINETYRSAYSNSNNNYNAAANNSFTLSAVNNAVQQTQENTSSQHFNSFDFARTLNLSFGMGYPMGKNRLIIEPFLKYPLSGLGAQDIKFGASGINLKLSFSTTKK